MQPTGRFQKCDSARSIRSRSRRRSKPDIEIELCCRSVSLQRCTAALGTDGKVCKTAVQTREPRHRHCVLLDAEITVVYLGEPQGSQHLANQGFLFKLLKKIYTNALPTA